MNPKRWVLAQWLPLPTFLLGLMLMPLFGLDEAAIASASTMMV
jgi:hypothetical protein